jgi:hypothetical protein
MPERGIGTMGYGSGIDFIALKAAVETTGGPDLQALVDLLADLDAKMKASQATYDAQNAAAAKLAAGLKAQQASVYDVGEAYDLLEPAIGAALTAAEKEAAATAFVTRQTRDLNDVLEALAQHEREAATATVALSAAQDKAGDGAKKAGEAGGYGALKWLFLSNALQDVQFGLQAVANNVPQLVQSFGGGAGLAGGLQVAVVALQIAINNVGKLRDLLGSRMSDNYKNSVEGLTEALDKLNAKKVKVQADFTAIEEAQKKLDRLKEAQAEWDRLVKKQTKQQQESAERAERAVVEYGGGDDEESSAEKVRAGVRAAMPFTSGSSEAEARAKIKAQQKVLDATTDPQQRSFVQQQLTVLRDSLAAARSDDLKAYNQQVVNLVTGATQGRQADITKLLGLYRGNTRAFEDAGVTEGFGPALAGASKSAVERDAYNKLDEAARKKAEADAKREDDFYDKTQQANADRNSKQWADLDADAQKKAEADRKKADAARKQKVAAAVSLYGPGYSGQIEAGLYEAKRNGGDVDAVAAGERGTLEAALRNRGADADVIGDVVTAILAKGKEAALNHVANGTKPALITRESAEAKPFAAGYLPQARALIAQNRAARMSGAPEVNSDDAEQYMRAMNLPYSLPEAVVSRRIARTAGQGLQATGRDPAEGAGVAEQATKDVDRQFQQEFARSGDGFQAMTSVTRSLLGAVMNLQGLHAQQQATAQGLQAGVDQAHANNARLHAGQQRGRMRRPPLAGGF